MKFVTIKCVDEPKDFSNVAYLKKDWEAASKLPPIRVPYGTAVENMRNSKGMYRILPEKDPIEVEIKGVKPPDEMSNQELVQVMTSFGKPPRKKMNRRAAVEFVQKLMDDAAAMIEDDE